MMADMPAVTHAPEEFYELCKRLYGPAVDADQMWVDVHKSSPSASDLSTRDGKLKSTGAKRTTAENIALATNALGVVAAPAAVTGAYKLARQGERGLPFKGAKKITDIRDNRRWRKTGRTTRTGGVLRQISNKAGRTGKIGAAALGAGAVGLQMANATGDAISARHFSKPKEEQPVGKAAPSVGADIKRMAGKLVQTWTPQQPAAAAPAKPPMPGGRTATKQAQAEQQAAARSAKHRRQGGDIGRAMNTTTGKVMAGVLGVQGLAATGRALRPPPAPYEYAPYAKREADVEIRGEFTKFDDDKRQAFGWASITKVDGVPVVDRQNDYIDIEDLETAAYNYVHKSRVGGDMHRRNGEAAHKVSDMIESMVFTPEKIEKMGLPDDFPQGWWVGYQIHDEDTWDEVRKRGRTGFSIHGKGLRKDHDLDSLMGA